jgi:hypothetical protein
MDRIEVARAAEQYRRETSRTGFKVPLPHFIKRSIIMKAFLEGDCKIFVETGTYLGDTPWALRAHAEETYTIEVSAELAAIARRRFSNFPHIRVVEGDSSERLREIMPRLGKKTLFWLDGHYSAGITGRGDVNCPIFAELEAILMGGCTMPSIILVDDARCFGVDADYPSLRELESYIDRLRPGAIFTRENDIVRVCWPDLVS